MNPCAQDVSAAANGSPIGPESQPSAPPTSSQDANLLLSLTQLILSLDRYTQATNRLAASNEALVQAMAQAEGDDEDPGDRGTYMDGSKR